jgi:hypothetical protein
MPPHRSQIPNSGNQLLDYCQFLLTSPFNYTMTYFADHVEGLSHDKVNRLLQQIDVDSGDLWKNVQETLVLSPNGYLVYDDTVLDKRHSSRIENVYKQYSGNAHKVIKGIGVVTCVYVNPELKQFWAIDYRIYDPKKDKKTKLEHVREMLDEAIDKKKLPVRTVLMDCWYADRELMLYIASLGKIYYTVVKTNRLVAEHQGQHAYQRIDTLEWSEEELQTGKRIRLNDFPNDHKVQLFRVIVLPGKTDFVVTNDLSQDDAKAVRRECKIRWKVEEFHREIKQLTGIEDCQCRKGVIQKNHIGCAMLVWAKLKNLAYQTGRTVYDICHSQYDAFLSQLLKTPILQMTIA